MKSKTANTNFENAFYAAKKALKELDITIDVADKRNKTINGSTNTSFLSWGEKIQINFYLVNQHATKIEVESTSAAQLIDWGKNDKNENEILKTISRYLTNK